LYHKVSHISRRVINGATLDYQNKKTATSNFFNVAVFIWHRFHAKT